MNEGKKLLLSSSISSLVAPTLFTIYFSAQSDFPTLSLVFFLFFVAWIVTVFHLLLLGLPIFVFLERSSTLEWPKIVLSGFIAGIIPVGIFTLPLLSVGSSDAKTWLRYAITCLPLGLSGTATAIVLWRTWLYLDAPKESSLRL